jgi:hypothetical protein
MQTIFVNPGDTIEMQICHSEAACWCKIAGTTQHVRIIDDRSAEVVHPVTGRPIGGAYLLGELGIYTDYSTMKHYINQ